MAQQHIKKSEKKEEKESGSPPAANPEVIKKGEKTVKDAAALIDQIDGILEENAGEFVKNYIQKGGE